MNNKFKSKTNWDNALIRSAVKNKNLRFLYVKSVDESNLLLDNYLNTTTINVVLMSVENDHLKKHKNVQIENRAIGFESIKEAIDRKNNIIELIIIDNPIDLILCEYTHYKSDEFDDVRIELIDKLQEIAITNNVGICVICYDEMESDIKATIENKIRILNSK